MFIRKSQNLTGALFMSISMAGYVTNDAFMKLVGSELGLAQKIFMHKHRMAIKLLVIFNDGETVQWNI